MRNSVTFFRKHLLWLEKDGVRKYHLVKWEIVCMPQDQGGLGVVAIRVTIFFYFVNGSGS
jgi:hypothetical protein